VRDPLTIAIYNVALLRVRVFGATFNEPVPFVTERFNALPAIIASARADIVMLQEIYETEHRLRLAIELRRVLPYAAFEPHSSLIRVSDGLMTLSRFPVTRPIFERFTHAPFGEQRLANKGFLTCDVETPNVGILRVVNVHTASGGILGYTVNPKHVHSRGKQIEQLRQRVETFRGDKVLVAGDFNTGPESSPQNYRDLLAAGYLDAYAEAQVRRGPLVTWDPQNPLTIDGPHRNAPAQRVDHAFIPPFCAHLFHVETADVLFDAPTVETATSGPVPPSDHNAVRFRLYRA